MKQNLGEKGCSERIEGGAQCLDDESHRTHLGWLLTMN
jgi:hypothetical protein